MSTRADRCLLCDLELPPRRWWQRIIGLSAPTCDAAGLDAVACHRRFRARLGLGP